MINNIFPKSLLSMIAAGALLMSASAFATNPPADPPPGGDSPYARGPDPTVSFLEASSGPYSTRTSRVSGLVSGFGGGTIHYPTGVGGTMAVVLVITGFVSSEWSMDWWDQKRSDHGLVMMTIYTSTVFDKPPSRARQINNALENMISQNRSRTSTVREMNDTDRLGVIG